MRQFLKLSLVFPWLSPFLHFHSGIRSFPLLRKRTFVEENAKGKRKGQRHHGQQVEEDLGKENNRTNSVGHFPKKNLGHSSDHKGDQNWQETKKGHEPKNIPFKGNRLS